MTSVDERAFTTPASLLDGLNIRFETRAPLAPLTWYGVGGPAAILAHPSSIQQLGELVARCRQAGVPMYTLGSGANLLVADEGVDGVVIQLDDPAFKQLRFERNIVTVGAGYDLMELVLQTTRRGLAGLEAMAGIPASVGGAVRMNAGGAFGEIGPAVRRVQVMSDTGQVYFRDSDDLIFGYRSTNIVAPFILDVEFELREQDADDLRKRVKEIFVYKKTTQPMADRSAGCAFKNPRRGSDDEDASKPLPGAGALIDRAGLKGHRVGGAEVSDRHANFIFTHEGCTAADILALMQHIQQAVLDHSGIQLQREVVVWP
jgi:UDP-N-acetylmuramate dehydrogenase